MRPKQRGFTLIELRLGIAIVGILATLPLARAGWAENLNAYYTRLDYTDQVSGKYADVVVELSGRGRLVFSREFSYLPYWQTAAGTWHIEELVPRTGDGPAQRPDAINRYSYVRIIENTLSRVVVHWRYLSQFADYSAVTNRDFIENIVHEVLTITADGTATRTVRTGSSRLEEFDDPANVTTQVLRLEAEGISEGALTRATLTRAAREPVEGTAVKEEVVGSPVAWWKFDEGLTRRSWAEKDTTRESVGGHTCAINGQKTIWKTGVSGTALAFDGYFSKVSLPASNAPRVEDDGITVEVWVAIGAYPWNDAPLVRHSTGTGALGYYLGIDPYGHAIFVVKGQRVRSAQPLPTYRWIHVAGTCDEGGLTRVYINGLLSGSIAISEPFPLGIPPTDLLIGLNGEEARATDPVRGANCNLPRVFGIEGLIDEVKIYAEALSQREMWRSYVTGRPASMLEHSPDLEPRVLPGEPGRAETFGARYTKLKYHELWDNLWRTSEWPDVVVKFDEMPTSVVFWRGANFGGSWVTDGNKWISPQSLEKGGRHGCEEHMSDKQNRHSHVRIVENTDARAVVHWRYAQLDVGYTFPSESHWGDEYFTVYPDGVTVRKVIDRIRPDRPAEGWGDTQVLSEAGTGVLDTIDRQALTVANLAGETHAMFWSGINGVPENKLPNSCIGLINLKSTYKTFEIFDERSRWGAGAGWGHWEQSAYTGDPFPGPWDHWPVGQMPSDGRFADTDRASSFAVGGADGRDSSALYGFTDKDVTSLIPLAKSWNDPPAVRDARGCSSRGYDRGQRAYLLDAAGPRISFQLDASETSPIVNPCFVIGKWGSRTARAALKIDGAERPCGPSFRQGTIVNTDGTPTMVVWVKMESVAPAEFEITKDTTMGEQTS